MNVYVFDLDGTLANIDHRLHFIKTKPKNWPAFFEACKDDAPVEWVIDLLRTVAQGKAYILVLSGRSEQVRKATEDWLIKHGVFYSELLSGGRMNAQRAYEYLNSGKTDLKGLIEALTGEKEEVEPPVKVGDRVSFWQDVVSSVGEVCYVHEDGSIRVGFDAEINGHGWEWYFQGGSDHAKKRGFKYGWCVDKGNYTVIGRA